MPRFIAIDWDQNQLHVVAADVRGGAIKIQRAFVWQEQQSPNLADAEALGRLLRDRLREAGIPPAPVFVSIGRDRVILKDIRHPPVPEADEAALVRFQAVKELTEPPDEVVIDYTPIGDRRQPGERRALAVIVRRDILNTWRKICHAAGLKLEAVTPRAFGVAAALRRVLGTTVLTPAPNPPDSPVAVAVIGERWAEFLVLRSDGVGASILLTRTIAIGSGLAGEIRRNLAVYGGQAGSQSVAALYLAGNVTPELRERLGDMLPDLPLHPFDPFGAGIDLPEVAPVARGAFAGAVGLLHAKSQRGGLPINFIHPREPRPPANNRRQYALVGLLVFVIFFGGGGYLCAKMKEWQNNEREVVQAELDKTDGDLNKILVENKRYNDIDKWETVVPLDELYDLEDRIPDVNKMRLKNITFVDEPRNTKLPYASRITMKATIVPQAGIAPITETLSQFAKDGGFYNVHPYRQNGNEVTVDIQVERRAPTAWKRELKLNK
jgi:Tfp pilus assembly PilM family ATPase